jgi:thiol-disulfide isomerase/thioredoxin
MLLRCLVLGFSLLIFENVALSADLKVGETTLTINAKRLDHDEAIHLGSGQHRVAIINFWGIRCAPCKTEMPAIETYYQKHKHEGLEVLAVNMDDPSEIEQIREYIKPYTFPVALKSETNYSGLGRIWRMPSTFILDKNGVLIKDGHEGKPTVDLEELERQVTPLLKPQPN